MPNPNENPPHVNKRPRLVKRARLQVDPVRKRAVLQSQESIILLNKTGHEILVRCDGTRTLSEIVKQLGIRYPIAQANLARDVSEYLERLGQKGLLEWI